MNPIKNCRACGSIELIEFLDLGEQYISDFRDDDSKPPIFPLVAVFCEDCTLVQLSESVPQEAMYHDRYGFKSGISESIKQDLDSIVTHAFQYQSDPASWLDIAQNDGTLLSFVPNDVFRVGVDPVGFLCEEAKQHADLIVNDYFNKRAIHKIEVGGFEKAFDVITSISCFYDMPKPGEFVSDVLSVLASRGVWIIQQNYLLTTLELNAVDNFCHEHLEYYTLLSLENLLERYGLEVNEVTTSMVNGGSIRTVVSRKGTYPVDESVHQQRMKEFTFGSNDIRVYREFAGSLEKELKKLKRLVSDLNSIDKRVVILAASTRGATIWQAAGLGPDDVLYAVERNPAKVGKVFSAIGIPIVSEEFFRKDKPDYALIGPWFFENDFVQREKNYLMDGGHLVSPLPRVKIIDKSYHEYPSDLAPNL